MILTFDILAANILCIATVAGNYSCNSFYDNSIKLLNHLGVKDNDYGPPPEPMFDSKAEEAREEPVSIRSEPGGSSKGDAIIGSIRYVSCSVAGSDPVDHPNDNDNEGMESVHPFCGRLVLFLLCLVNCLFSLGDPFWITVFQPTLSKRRVSVAGTRCP